MHEKERHVRSKRRSNSSDGKRSYNRGSSVKRRRSRSRDKEIDHHRKSDHDHHRVRDRSHGRERNTGRGRSLEKKFEKERRNGGGDVEGRGGYRQNEYNGFDDRALGNVVSKNEVVQGWDEKRVKNGFHDSEHDRRDRGQKD